MSAVVAPAGGIDRRRRNKPFLRILTLHLVQVPLASVTTERIGRIRRSVLQQSRRTPDVIGRQQHRPFAFGMRQHLRFGILSFFKFQDLFRPKFFVDAACAVPYDHILPAGQLFDVISQIPIGSEIRSLRVGRQAFDHLHRIARRTNIGQRFDPDRRIDVRTTVYPL